MITDIKSVIEEKMAERGYTRAQVCQRLGIAPQGWSNKMRDAKWSVICKVCGIIGIEPVDLFQPKEETSSLIECPHCHKVIKLKAEEV